MKEIHTEIKINASPSTVWKILTNFNDYPRWNPFIKEISGNQQVESRIEAFIRPPNSKGMKIKPVILAYHPEKELRWLGRLWIPKLVDGEHSLIIDKIDENKVLFIQKEKFTGLIVPLLSGMLKDTEDGFKMMNHALKIEAEANNNY